MSIDFTPDEYTLVRKQARRVASKWKAASAEDIEAELLLWLCENYRHVVRYRTEEGGRQKLGKSLYRYGLNKAMREQEQHNGKRLQDDWSPYTKEQVKAVLPYVWDREEWPMQQATVDPRHGGVVHTGDTRGGEALSMLIDVAAAVARLSEKDKAYLRGKFRDGYSTRELGEMHGLSPESMSRRLWDAVDKTHARLAESAYRSH